MANRIFKYEVMKEVTTYITMPIGAEILSLQVIGDDLFVWASVDEDADFEVRPFLLLGDGFILPSNTGNYIGTFTSGFTGESWHLFELETERKTDG